jgi:hypothetical protein
MLRANAEEAKAQESQPLNSWAPGAQWTNDAAETVWV